MTELTIQDFSLASLIVGFVAGWVVASILMLIAILHQWGKE